MPQILNSSAAIQQYLNRGGSIDQLLTNVKYLLEIINDSCVCLTSPNGTKFKVAVTDYGSLTVTPLKE